MSGWRERTAFIYPECLTRHIFFSRRERAALQWTEALTRISETDVSDELYESVRKHFADADLIALTMVVIAINGWNRLAISFRNIPGSYKPELAK